MWKDTAALASRCTRMGGLRLYWKITNKKNTTQTQDGGKRQRNKIKQKRHMAIKGAYTWAHTQLTTSCKSLSTHSGTWSRNWQSHANHRIKPHTQLNRGICPHFTLHAFFLLFSDRKPSDPQLPFECFAKWQMRTNSSRCWSYKWLI